MTALGKVVRTTAFKLSAIYIAVFSVFAVAFVLYISYTPTRSSTSSSRTPSRPRSAASPSRAASAASPAIVETIEQRSHQPGASLYLITDVNGRILAGNVCQVPATCFEQFGHAADHRAL